MEGSSLLGIDKTFLVLFYSMYTQLAIYSNYYKSSIVWQSFLLPMYVASSPGSPSAHVQLLQVMTFHRVYDCVYRKRPLCIEYDNVYSESGHFSALFLHVL